MTFNLALRCFAHHAVRCDRHECQAELAWRTKAVEEATPESLPPKPYAWVFRPKESPK